MTLYDEGWQKCRRRRESRGWILACLLGCLAMAGALADHIFKLVAVRGY